MDVSWKTIFYFFILIANPTSISADKWELFETGGQMCYPVLITWFTSTEQGCKKACSRTPNVKFCQYDAARTNWCMMGRTCNKLISKPGYKFVVWREANYKRHERCIRLSNGGGGGCKCSKGICNKPDIKKWLGGKCGAAISHKQQVCHDNDCGLNYSKDLRSGRFLRQFTWRERKSTTEYPNGIRFAPQFEGPYVYDFPRLNLDEDFEPTDDNENLPLLFGFNEPDRTQSAGGGSVMSIDSAIKYWKLNVINGIKKGYKTFVSPAITEALPRNYNKSMRSTYWLPQFLDRIASEPIYEEYHEINGKLHHVEIDWKSTIDYLAVHKHQEDWNEDHQEPIIKVDIEATISAVKVIMEEYNEQGFDIKGIWMTEFTSLSSEKCKTLK